MATATLEAPAAPSAATASRSAWLRPLSFALPWLLSIGLTAIAYGGSLGAGIMFDAGLDLPRATDRTWLQIISSAGDWPYYRPLILLITKAAYELRGYNDFTLLHGISLASHILFGWLLYQLCRRLWDWRFGALAAALFLLFPLNYQLVAFADPPSHGLMGMFLAAALVLYLDGRIAAALVCGALALFTHENAVVMLFPAVFGLDVISGRWRRSSLLFAGETLAFLVIWWLVPRWPSSFHLDVPSIELNAAYFFQALAYPVTMQLGALPRAGNDVLEVVLATLVVVAMLLLVCALRHRVLLALFGLLWFGASVGASCLLLPWPNYVIDAPRLIYVGSAGVALLWAGALAPSGHRVWDGVGLAVTAAVLAVSFGFIEVRDGLLDKGADVVNQVLATSTMPGLAAGRTYVNVPAFLGPPQPDFLLGHSGITMLPDYFGLDLQVAAATGLHLPIASVAYDELARPWEAAYAPQGRRSSLPEVEQAIHAGGGVYVTRFDPGRLRLEYAGQVGGGSTGSLATLGNFAILQSATARSDGRQIDVSLVWRALAPAPKDYTVFVHVTAASPQPLVQDDGYPIDGLLPPQDWRAGDVITDERHIPLPAGLAGQQVHVLVGLYDRASPASRAAAVGPGGSPFADDAVPVTEVTL